jgi:hypothetical protein
MPLNTLLKYNAANTRDAMDMYAATISGAGWELWDFIPSPYGYVFKSKGSDNSEMPVYIHITDPQTNEIEMYMYAGWDADTHTGTFYCGNPTYTNMDTDDDGSFYIWVSANEDSFFISAFVAEIDAMYVTRTVPFYEPCYGRLAASVNAGSSQTITLSAGDTSGFQLREYRIFNEAHRELTNVTSIIPSANQIVVDSLTYNYVAGDRIAIHPFRWAIWSSENDFAYLFHQDTNGTGNDVAQISRVNLVNTAYGDPDSVTGLYILVPVYFTDNSNTGINNMMHNNCVFRHIDINVATSEESISIFDYDNGTVTSATSASITDNTKSWTVNEYADKVLIITAGTGSPDFVKIVSNTSDTITTDRPFVITPDGTSTYMICEEGWMHLYVNNSASQAGCIRIV